MARRFPPPLFGLEDIQTRSETFVTIARVASRPLEKAAFVDRCRERYRKSNGERYSQSYLRRIIDTYVQLGVLRQTTDGITVWEPAHDWAANELDFETFLWYALKRNWVLEGEFPEGIEGLHDLHQVIKHADTPLSRGTVESRLTEKFEYAFNAEGIRGYPKLLVALGAIEREENGYVATPNESLYATRFRNADVRWQLERWLKREGPNTTPPPDAVKRDLMKYYMYRESGGHGRHRQLYETFRTDYLADSRSEENVTSTLRRAGAYLEEERHRDRVRTEIRERFPTFDGRDLAGLSTTLLERMAAAPDVETAQQINAGSGAGISRAALERAADETAAADYQFPPAFSLYPWQQEAVDAWQTGTDERQAETGIAQVVTGAGKTVMALEAIRRWLDEHPDGVVTVVVPTKVLLNQWLTELVETLRVPVRDVGWVGDGQKDSFDDSRILVAIVNSAVKDDYVAEALSAADSPAHLLVADECHRYTGDVHSNIFAYHRTASLGLSATPFSDPGTDDRSEADDRLLTELGPVYYSLSYDEALTRELIPEFRVNYIGFDLTPAERHTYERLSRTISDAISEIEQRYGNQLYDLSGAYQQKLRVLMDGVDGPTPAITDYFRYTQERRELVADAVARQAITLHLLQETIDADKKAIVFQERIAQLERMIAPTETRGRNVQTGELSDEDVERARLYDQYPALKAVDQELEDLFFTAAYRPVMYHSGHRTSAWNDFAIEWFGDGGFANVMLSVKALVEGVDVPSADVGIVRVSSGSVRQRIQTLGRVLRTGSDASRSELNVLYARDTVDEQIFYDYDWDEEFATAEIRHLTWAHEESVLEGEIALGEPPTGPEPPVTVPDPETVSRGEPYPGPRDGYRISVNSEGRPFEKTSNGRCFITNDSIVDVAGYVERHKNGGQIIINHADHALTVLDGELIFLGIVDAPSSFEYGECRSGGLTDDPDGYDDIFGS